MVCYKIWLGATSLTPPINTPIATVGSCGFFDSSHAHTGYAERQKELGDKLGHDVATELWKSVFCDVPEFLETMFPMDTALLSHLYGTLKKNQLYQTNATPPHWTHYPTHPPNEALPYEPFVQLAEDIEG